MQAITMKTQSKSMKNAFLTFLAVFFVFFLALLLVAPDVSAQTDSIRRGVRSTGGSTTQGQAENQLFSAIETGVDIFSLIVGVIAVVMIIIGGLKYITSGGDSNSVSSAKNTLLYAVIGLVVVVLAQAIVFFVLDETAGQTPSEDENSSMVDHHRLS